MNFLQNFHVIRTFISVTRIRSHSGMVCVTAMWSTPSHDGWWSVSKVRAGHISPRDHRNFRHAIGNSDTVNSRGILTAFHANFSACYVAKLIIHPIVAALDPIRTQPLDHNTLRGYVHGSGHFAPRILSISVPYERDHEWTCLAENSDYLEAIDWNVSESGGGFSSWLRPIFASSFIFRFASATTQNSADTHSYFISQEFDINFRFCSVENVYFLSWTILCKAYLIVLRKSESIYSESRNSMRMKTD